MVWLGVFCLLVVGAAILVIAGFILVPLLWLMTGLIAICYLMSLLFSYAQRRAELRHQERMRVLELAPRYVKAQPVAQSNVWIHQEKKNYKQL